MRPFLDLRLDPNLAHQTDPKIHFSRAPDMVETQQITYRNHSFDVFVETLALAFFLKPFLTPFITQLAPEVVTVGAKWLAETPEKVPERALQNRPFSELWK